MSRSIVGAEAEALVREIEALYAKGLPARTKLTVAAQDGEVRIHLGRLFIECAVVRRALSAVPIATVTRGAPRMDRDAPAVPRLTSPVSCSRRGRRRSWVPRHRWA